MSPVNPNGYKFTKVPLAESAGMEFRDLTRFPPECLPQAWTGIILSEIVKIPIGLGWGEIINGLILGQSPSVSCSTTLH